MKKTIFHILPMALLASCTSELADMNVNNVTEGNVDKVTIKSKAFVYGDDTRTSLTATDNGISFAWASYDALGVFPITPESNNQAKQALNINSASCENDAHYASFDGAGWGLKKENTYAAYTPYNGDIPSSTPYTSVPIDMTGQDGTLATIGKKYDYMYAPSTFSEEGCANGSTHEVVFDFNHAIAIIQFKLTMPVAATWKSIALSNQMGENVWVTSATMNVSTGEIKSIATTSSVSLAFNNITTTENNKELVAYLAALPTTTGELQLTAVASDGTEYIALLESKVLEAGKAYRYKTSDMCFSASGRNDGYPYINLGLDSGLKWATMNVGATSPLDYGNYYAWGETKALGEADETNLMNYNYNNQQSYVKTCFSWATYKWCNGAYNTLTKYCVDESLGTVDHKTTLEAKDDAACENMGKSWRMPKCSEWVELVNNCYWVWSKKYMGTNKAGYIVYKAKTPSDKGVFVRENGIHESTENYSLSDCHIFLPAAGYYAEDTYRLVGTYGCYWSSSLYNGDDYGNGCEFAYGINFFPSTRNSGDAIFFRLGGRSIRAVCE